MRRLKRAPRKMQRQVFKYALMLPLIVLLLFSLIIYFYVSQILISREDVTLRNLNSSLMNQIEANLEDLDYVTADINYINRLTGFLSNVDDWTTEESRNTILSIVGSERNAYQVNLYPPSGELTGVVSLDGEASARALEASWLQAAQEMRGKKLLSAPYNTTQHSYAGQRNWLLSVYRAALDSKNNVIGTLEAVGRCQQIFSAAISYSHRQKDGASLYIFDENGTQIYPYDVTGEERSAAQAIFQLTVENPDSPQTIQASESKVDYQYVRSHSNYSGWNYISLQKRSVIFQPVYRLIAMLAGVGAILFLMSILFAWVFARRMVRPVHRLQHLVQHLRLDTLGQIPEDDRPVAYEELDELFKDFRTMSESLETSLEELQVSRQLEFKSQMTALQMQTNPHFYYNTLSCISVLAENGQTEDVASMCRTLSDLMRYISDTNTSEVMLFQELGIIQKYLYCMKMRYQDSLKITVETDERLNSILIPKLLLQPLVENAVKYGTDCLPPWHLRITGTMEDDRWYFTVEDSGNGFSAAALDTLGAQIREIDSAERAGLPPQKIGGMGIINVYLRWKLYCRGGEIFEYGNNADGHAYVTIGRRTS